MDCQHCSNDIPMRDWSYYSHLGSMEKTDHFYCTRCGSHYHKGEWYTKEQWFFYINEISFEEYQRQEREKDVPGQI